MDSLRPLFLRYLAQTSDSPISLEIDHGEGVYLYDRFGKRYLDLISGISVSNIGHSHPEVIKAIKEQADKHMHLLVYGEYIQLPQVRLAELIVNLLPPELDNIYFVNSGAEAVEGALKLSKRYTGRSEIVAFRDAYHGSTHGALSVTGGEWLKRAYRPLLPDVRFLKFGSREDLVKLSEKTACVIIEPVQGEAGIMVPPDGYLEAVRERCNEKGCLLIFDEIQTGCGRTGKLFAFEHTSIKPDILLLAKAFGGGMPLGAFIASKDIMSALSINPPLGHITTFGGNPVSCAASYAALNVIIKNRLWEGVDAKEKQFLKLLNHPDILEVRSKGLLLAIELGSAEHVKKVIRYCIEQGVITDWFLFRETALRIAPPLIITEEQINEACRVIIAALNTMN